MLTRNAPKMAAAPKVLLLLSLGLGLAACGLEGSSAIQAPEGAAPQQSTVVADWHSQKTPPLEAGQIELLTLSNPPSVLSGGDARVAVRGLQAEQAVVLRVNGELAQLREQRRGADSWEAVVEGLPVGESLLEAQAGDQVARLTVRNHPLTGPILSGPQRTPHICRTVESGLGEPLDADCSIEPRVDWFYRSQANPVNFLPLPNPAGPYPPDVATTQLDDGRFVPFVVRVESFTLNRSIARIAVLDDPAARADPEAFEPLLWNRNTVYNFGGGCNTGFDQGRHQPFEVLGDLTFDVTQGSRTGEGLFVPLLTGVTDLLGRGFISAHTSFLTLAVLCNELLASETAVMLREYIVDHYGTVQHALTNGGSGGSIQQHILANRFPGVLSGITPFWAFPDLTSLFAFTLADCALMVNYWEQSELSWTLAQKAAVAGHNFASTCQGWTNTPRRALLIPERGCIPEIRESDIWDPETNPDGVRCTVWDYQFPQFGVDPATGLPALTLDNLGVQYGLAALNAGAISVAQFLDLNRAIGSIDPVTGAFRSQRARISDALARHAYRTNVFSGRGALDQVPAIDLNLYVEPVPPVNSTTIPVELQPVNVHDAVRSLMTRARLAGQGSTGTFAIWNGFPGYPEAYRSMLTWLDGIEAFDLPAHADRREAVATARPARAADHCVFALPGGLVSLGEGVTLPLGVEVNPLSLLLAQPFVQSLIGTPANNLLDVDIPLEVRIEEEAGLQASGVCAALFPPATSTRMAAGGPLTEDVLKCQLKPLDPRDYAVSFSSAQWAELQTLFPQGACDWSRPSIGSEVEPLLWPSFGGEDMEIDEAGIPAVTPVKWTVGRS